MIIADLAIFPTSEGISVSRYVKEVICVIENSGLKNVTGGMSTTIESPDLQSLFAVIEQAHDLLIEMGARRIHIDLRVDHRTDKEASIHSKLKAVGKNKLK
ncbi:MAG: MTH1187 family thiamine-binding protein [Candidatus Aminicenantes bacterium]|nr:MTH1187 family thiamine-binding protein [Candidatus Aminicenantes bacterium]